MDPMDPMIGNLAAIRNASRWFTVAETRPSRPEFLRGSRCTLRAAPLLVVSCLIGSHSQLIPHPGPSSSLQSLHPLLSPQGGVPGKLDQLPFDGVQVSDSAAHVPWHGYLRVMHACVLREEVTASRPLSATWGRA